VSAGAPLDAKEVTLLEILDRVIDHGVYLSGDITISVADVDLIYLGLRVMLTSVERADELRGGVIPTALQEATSG
jgi:gas vesicle structural protein